MDRPRRLLGAGYPSVYAISAPRQNRWPHRRRARCAQVVAKCAVFGLGGAMTTQALSRSETEQWLDGVEGVVDTARYPLHEPGGARCAEVVARVRGELAATGCSVLQDFVLPGPRADVEREGDEMAPDAYDDVETVNVYNTDPDASLPPEHPARTTLRRGNAFVARDRIPATSTIARLYASDAVRGFVAACFGRTELHRLADPLSGLTLNVVAPGREHPWHFDTNDTVSMLTRRPEAGGVFEFCPGIRSARDERLDDVRGVLAGDDRLVRRLDLRPGDLQLFLGRTSLHRVTTVAGGQHRHSAIFAYSDLPDVVGSLARTRQLFGRVTPAHTAAAGRQARADRLLD